MVDVIVNDPLGKFVQKFGLHDIVEARTNGRSIYIMGDGGAGKTTLAATLIETQYGSPAMYIDVDGGVHVISSKIDQGIYYYKFEGCTKLELLIRGLVESCPFKAIVLDNGSALAYEKLQEMRKQKPQEEDWRLYNDVTNYIQVVCETLHKIAQKYNIIVVVNFWTLIETDTNDVTHRRIIPALNPALLARVQGIPDILAYLTVEDDAQHTRKLTMTPPTSRLLTKFRRDTNDVAQTIPEELWNPSLAPIVDTLINGVPFPKEKFIRPSRAPVRNPSQASIKAVDDATQVVNQ